MILIRIILFASVFASISCNTEIKSGYPIPDSKDVSEIIQLVAAQDSLFSKKANRPLAVDLQLIRLLSSKLELSEPKYYSIYLDELLNETNADQKVFSQVDSAYLMFQSQNSEQATIDTLGLSGFKFTTLYQQNQLLKAKRFKAFIALTSPLFSLDQTKAYVAINDFCGMCGGGKAVFLTKINGRWKIVKVWNTWVS